MHTLITGVTMTGKTTMARMLAREHDHRGHPVVVYDPMGTDTAGGDWGKNAKVFNDEEKFMRYMGEAPPSAVFIDESDLVFAHSQKENHWLARRGRHYGHRLYMITQRPQMIAPNCRNQTGRCYMFRLSRSDADFVYREFGHTLNAQEYDMDTGDFYVLTSGARKITKSNVFHLLGTHATKSGTFQPRKASS
jgi:hypothetical protein